MTELFLTSLGSCDWLSSRHRHRPALRPGPQAADFLLGCPQAELAGWGFVIVFKPQLVPLNCPGLSLCPFPNPAGKNNRPPQLWHLWGAGWGPGGGGLLGAQCKHCLQVGVEWTRLFASSGAESGSKPWLCY